MADPITLALISAGLSAANTAVAGINSRRQAKVARQNTRDTIQANKELAEYAYQKDLEQWHRMNEYNDPSAQMARLESAGLNPNLVYGSGSAATQAAPAPSYKAPNVEYRNQAALLPNIPAMIGQYQDFKMKQAQIDNVRANTELTSRAAIAKSFEATLTRLRAEDIDYALKNLRPHESKIKEADVRMAEMRIRSELQRLKLMSQEEQLNELRKMQGEKDLTLTDHRIERQVRENLWLKYRNEWMKEGVTTSDNPLLRIISRMMIEAGLTDLF